MKHRPHSRPRKPLTTGEMKAAIVLCHRPEGATSRDLAKVMHCADIDAPHRLRYFIRTYTAYILYSRRMTPERRLREGYIGPASTYHLRLKELSDREAVHSHSASSDPGVANADNRNDSPISSPLR